MLKVNEETFFSIETNPEEFLKESESAFNLELALEEMELTKVGVSIFSETGLATAALGTIVAVKYGKYLIKFAAMIVKFIRNLIKKVKGFLMAIFNGIFKTNEGFRGLTSDQIETLLHYGGKEFVIDSRVNGLSDAIYDYKPILNKNSTRLDLKRIMIEIISRYVNNTRSETGDSNVKVISIDVLKEYFRHTFGYSSYFQQIDYTESVSRIIITSLKGKPVNEFKIKAPDCARNIKRIHEFITTLDQNESTMESDIKKIVENKKIDDSSKEKLLEVYKGLFSGISIAYTSFIQLMLRAAKVIYNEIKSSREM